MLPRALPQLLSRAMHRDRVVTTSPQAPSSQPHLKRVCRAGNASAMRLRQRADASRNASCRSPQSIAAGFAVKRWKSLRQESKSPWAREGLAWQDPVDKDRVGRSRRSPASLTGWRSLRADQTAGQHKVLDMPRGHLTASEDGRAVSSLMQMG